jgi:3-oxoacyl-[acyl-carrier protein] reductase
MYISHLSVIKECTTKIICDIETSVTVHQKLISSMILLSKSYWRLMELGIAGKTALVTGASRGIGRATCIELANLGVNIVAVARNNSDLEKLNYEINQTIKFTAIGLDLAEPDNLSGLFRTIDSRNIPIDIIVNNLGGNLNLTDPLGPYDEFEKVLYLNFGVAVEVNRNFIPKMQEKKWGRICHISSISALENQGPPQYSAAKAALNAYVRSVGRYLASDNVILNGVMPGAVLTEDGYWDIALKTRPEHVQNYLHTRMAIKRFGTLDEVTKVIAFLVSDFSSFMVGSMVLVDGGQGRGFQDIES